MRKFQKIHVEISNICNLQCHFCPPVERHKKIMDLKTFQKIIPQIKSLTETVCLHLMGEPLSHPQFSEIVQECEEHNLPIFLVTNGTLLNEQTLPSLLKPIFRQINFSLHSFPDNFPKAHPQTYLNKIFEISEKIQLTQPETYINYRLWNLQETKISSENSQSKNSQMFEIVLKQIEIWQNDHGLCQGQEIARIKELSQNLDIKKQKSIRLWKKIYLHFDTEFIWPSLDLPLLGTQGTCYGLNSHFGILADGTVVPCCLDKEGKIPLGNIHENSVIDILSNPKSVSILEGFRQNKLVNDLCQRCQYIERFKK